MKQDKDMERAQQQAENLIDQARDLADKYIEDEQQAEHLALDIARLAAVYHRISTTMERDKIRRDLARDKPQDKGKSTIEIIPGKFSGRLK